MFCYKCGAPINQGELFCSACGAKQPGVQGEPTAAQQPPVQQPYVAQPAYGQPYGEQQPPKKKSKKLLWISIAAVLVVAIAAAVVFVVLPAMGGGGGGLLSGNTVQTKFVNDNAKVFSGAFSDLSNGTFEKMQSEPFDLSIDLTSDVGGQQFTGTVEAAYDKQTLGFNAESNGVTSKLLLLGDTLYTDSNGYVSGLKFNTDADLSKAMSLSERFKAIFQSITGNAGAAAKLDYRKLAELLVNSISADCFESSGTSTTLTLTPNDIIATMKAFTDSLDKDKALKTQLEDYIKEVSGMPINVVDVLSTAVQGMEATIDSGDFEIVWTVNYQSGAPVSLELAMNMGEDSFRFEFGYEKQDGGKDVTFALSTQDGSTDVSGDVSYKKTAGGIEYSGSVTAMGGTLKLNGSEQWSGEKTHGDVTVSAPGSGDFSIAYDENLKYGMPQGSVSDDSRFSVDISGANVTEISSILDYFTIASSTISQVTPEPQVSVEPAVTEEPVVTDEPSATYNIAVLVPSADSTYYQEIVMGLQTQLGDFGGELNVIPTNYDAQVEIAQANTLLATGVDGLVIASVSDNTTIASIQSQADATGVPVVFLSDFTDGTVNAVSCDYKSMGETLAGGCTGNVYIISGTADAPYSKAIEESFLSSLGSDVAVQGEGYSNFDAATAQGLAETALSDYSELNAILCLDPASTQAVLETLNTQNFTGTFACFTDEGTMNQMAAAAQGSVYVINACFTASDVAYAAAGRMIEMLGGDTVPQVKYVLPYTY